MCGILLSIRPISNNGIDSNDSDSLFERLLAAVRPRGPDSLQIHTSIFPLDGAQRLEVKLASSVLGLRGRGITPQPLQNNDAVLAWNGQVFQGLSIGPDENDTTKLFEQLQNGESPLDVLTRIEGPYAFVFLDKRSNRIYYQLDPLSRRSLLIHTPSSDRSDRFIVCSARSGDDLCRELPMRAMDGGEGGIISLDKIRLVDGTFYMEEALVMGDLSGYAKGRWTHVSPINTRIPDAGTKVSMTSEVDIFIDQLLTAVRRRIENIPPIPGSARLAILFSGGVDCTLLASLAHRCLPPSEPIDLINVAFQRSPDAINGETDYAVPDRVSGLEAVEELRQSSTGREWRFVEVNVPHKECLEHRQKVVDLMYPSYTEMDLSLAFPLYFASRGAGTAQTSLDGPKTAYTVRPRVFLSGLGADEQLAGYARHRHAYRKGGWVGLVAELQMDISRLPTRNLSRDDRIITSHARDARFPYLDLTFVSYLSSLPVYLKCDPTIEGGDKLLLRLAAEKCGLDKTSKRVKRAMQFGTRSAKVGGAGKGAKKGDLTVLNM